MSTEHAITRIFSDYAEIYDLLYEDKDYAGEAQFLQSVLQKLRPGSRDVLDLACGTGRHVFELEKLGFNVQGSDSSPAMVRHAREMADARGSRARFHDHSFQSAHEISGRFDAVVSMFCAVGYLTTDEDLGRALANVRSLLSPGGLFVFDYWNGNAVVRDYQPLKVRRVRDRRREIVRTSETQLDLIAQVAEVKFTFRTIDDGSKTTEFEELHKVRFFFFREMDALLRASGFRIAHQSPFMDLERPVQPHDWSICVAARPI